MVDSHHNKKTFTRNELYEMVWSKPLTTLAKDYNYSDNGLRKLCKKHNIPTPNAGHWAKLRHGKPSPKKILPKGQNNKIKIYTRSEVKKVKEVLKTQKTGLYGQGRDIIYSKGDCLGTEVTKQNIPRAMKIWDSLIKLILERGHEIEENKSPKF